ncbi:endonuclease/exonuclease/phosphatase family protein [Zeaxanthinibacter sp. PT1]|uniref:endonuclease/exonuclease/phosphatase family protein n=1 Tax=Zeaxanthinibacter TaxID=561554 RepID=UPI0023494924|nr:endonuclease/exonuclease/phosphatase family protein [Zeaxanthinibacter sp. PT1]MDC6352175.1 endonuclease/exonuclease/phosphatase family protein [Zeaxanthinibacter sp. PT1]
MKAFHRRKRTSSLKQVKKISAVGVRKLIDGLLRIITIAVSSLLLLSCLTPYVPVRGLLSFFGFVSLGVPLLVLTNLLFFLFWLLRKKRILIMPLTALVLGYFLLGSFFQFRLKENPIDEEDLSILTFNAHGFNNGYRKIKRENVDLEIIDFVNSMDPDIVCFQEYDGRQSENFQQHPYRYINLEAHRSTQAILSKYPIVGKGSLDFPETGNNAIYADILYKKDTIRVYNMHFQSFQVIPSRRLLTYEYSGRALGKLSDAFPKQQQQAELLKAHSREVSYPVIISGDMNNTQFSNVYRTVAEDMEDSFEEAGTGYGRSYNFRYFPLRIDFILADQHFETRAHKNFNVKLSDHFPVMASFRLNQE